MNNLKLTVISLLLILLPILYLKEGIGFNFNNYKQMDISELNEFLNNYEKREGHGVGIFRNNIKSSLEYSGSLEDITESRFDCTVLGILFSQKLFTREQLNLFRNKFVFMSEGITYNVLVQDALVSPLNESVKKGETIEAYFILVLFNTADKNAFLLLNSFIEK